MPGIAYEFIKRYNDRFIYLTIQYTSKSYWMFTSSNKVQLSVEPISELENKKKICSWITELNPEDNSIRIQDMAHIVRSISKCSVNDEIVSECLEKLQIGDGYKEFISLCKEEIGILKFREQDIRKKKEKEEKKQREEEKKRKEEEKRRKEKEQRQQKEKEKKLKGIQKKQKRIQKIQNSIEKKQKEEEKNNQKQEEKIDSRNSRIEKLYYLVSKNSIPEITKIRESASTKRADVRKKNEIEIEATKRRAQEKIAAIKVLLSDDIRVTRHNEKIEIDEIEEWERIEIQKILDDIKQNGIIRIVLNEKSYEISIDDYYDLNQFCAYINKPEIGRIYNSPKNTFDHIEILVGLSQIVSDDEVKEKVKKYGELISGMVIDTIKNDSGFTKYNIPINYLKIDNIIFDKKARVLHYWLSLKIIE